jgi:short subunit dehydrogenase-like uncharacterized protein
VIGLLGATGYTGQLVAAELSRRGLPHRLGARRPPAALGAVAVDVTDRQSLEAFFDGISTVINTVGPFADLGLPVVEAAAEAGVAYVDSTGEPAFMSEVYDRFSRASVPLVPACGFDYVPGDLAAAVAVADLGSATVEEVTITYELAGMVPSRGTARTALGTAGSMSLIPKRRRIAFPDGEKGGVEIPWGERVTVPRWLPTARVATVLVVNDTTAAVLQASAVIDSIGAALGAVGGLMRPVRTGAALLKPVVEPLIRMLPAGPSEPVRRRSRFRILAEARAGRRRAAVLIEGNDVYALTARFLVEAALQVGGAGALTPAQALDPEPFLKSVAGDGLTWQRVEGRP